MNPKRWIAAIAAFMLAGAASLLVANPASSHEGEDHSEETTTTAPATTAPPMEHEMETTTTVPAQGETPAPEVPGEPGFTG